MTREEAIEHGKEQLEIFGGKHREFIKMAIKALEQKPILDKIIAEIEKALSAETISDNNQQISDVGIGLELALSIIDNYKEKREE